MSCAGAAQAANRRSQALRASARINVPQRTLPLCPRPLERMQHLVAPIHPGAGLLFPRECDRILDVANDTPVHEVQFGREVELDRHARVTARQDRKFLENDGRNRFTPSASMTPRLNPRHGRGRCRHYPHIVELPLPSGGFPTAYGVWPSLRRGRPRPLEPRPALLQTPRRGSSSQWHAAGRALTPRQSLLSCGTSPGPSRSLDSVPTRGVACRVA